MIGQLAFLIAAVVYIAGAVLCLQRGLDSRLGWSLSIAIAALWPILVIIWERRT